MDTPLSGMPPVAAGLQVAKHEALLGAVDGRAASAHAPRDIAVAGAGIGGQQNLRPLEFARRILAPLRSCAVSTRSR